MSHRNPCPCGASCSFVDEEGPCWGAVDVVAEEYDDEDYWWIHECEGHEGFYDGKDRKYKPQNE